MSDIKILGIAVLISLLAGFWIGTYIADHRADEAEVVRLKALNEQIAQVNADNATLTNDLKKAGDLAGSLQSQLRDALGSIKTVTVTRTVWREREAQNPTCAAWLDAVVPCQLRVPSADDH
jgi:septal ring factor EnvC (AmiA/AmiB activator)